MPHLASTLAVVLGAASNVLGCTIPTTPLSNTITKLFSIKTQNPTIPRVHNYVMNFRSNGDDEHLVLRPDGFRTYDSLWLDNGLLRTRNIHGVIDLEYDDQTDTTKLFMTERSFHPAALFQPVYGCDPDTDELQIRLQLVSRQTNPPVTGGQIGIREVVGTYEFRYSPPNNPKLNASFRPVNMVIFQDGPKPGTTTTSAPPVSSTTTRPPSSSTTTTTSQIPSSSTTTTSLIPSSSSTTTTTRSFTTSIVPTTTRISTTTAATTSSRTTTSGGPVSTPPAQGPYSYISCWADPEGGRALTAIFQGHDDMTNAKCASICSTAPNNYQYFGTQYGRECFCGASLTSGSVAAPESDCSFACAGDANQKCGGSRRLSLYKNTVTGGPSHPSSIGAYNLYGCVTDKVSARTLVTKTLSSSTMTLETCATFCAGSQFFGTEYGIECFCGSSFTAGAATVDISQCSMTCGGNSLQYCGNGDRLSVYQLA